MIDKIKNEVLPHALKLLPEKMATEQAKIMLLAIGLQESGFIYARQLGNGPARGYWQFEKNGGVKGVMTHPSTKVHAQNVCKALGVDFNLDVVYNTLETNHVLAACFARLLLWTDPKSLPASNDSQGTWDLYLRVWRPGKPREETWLQNYKRAQLVILDSDSSTVPPQAKASDIAAQGGKFALSKTSLSRLEGVHPKLVAVVKRAIQITDIDFMVVEGIRTLETQRKYVAKGASKTMNSYHLKQVSGYGCAVDLAPLVNGAIPWNDWSKFAYINTVMQQAAKELGVPLEWGGNWTSLKDGPHYQVPRDLKV